MWLLHVFLLLSITCLGNGEDTCPGYVFEVCDNPIHCDSPTECTFPKCDSELESLCLNLKQFAECVINYKEICPEMVGPTLEFAQNLLTTSNSFCKNDSTWFKGLLKYGSCYDNFFGPGGAGRECSPDLENKFELLISNTSDQPLWRCYIDVREATRVIENLPKVCGKLATELALHFFNGVSFWSNFCLDHKEEAIQKMDEFEITFNPETSEEGFAAALEDLSASYGPNKDLCLSNYKNVCQNPGSFIDDFPDNSENLAARCTEQIKYRECLTDYQQNCGEKIWGLDSFEIDLDTLNTFCDESSVLFHALVDNGKCFKKFYQNYVGETADRIYECVDEIENRDPEKHREEYIHRYPPGDYEKRYCFSDLKFLKCLSEEISKDCGDNAKELMLQALSHNRMRITDCKDILEEAEIFMRELKFNLDPENSFQDFIASLQNEA